MVGVFFRPNREGDFPAPSEQQGATLRVEGPMALSVHSPTVVQFLSTHATHEFVKFTGQAFFFS